jgi:hypothetical protein
MQDLEAGHTNPQLKELVVAASQALARMDTPRLEELAHSCRMLNQAAMVEGNAKERKLLAQQARDATADMAVFARVLDATRANLNVMNRLRELREGRLEYTERQARGDTATEAGHGEH